MLTVPFNHSDNGQPDEMTIRFFLTGSIVLMQNDADRHALPEDSANASSDTADEDRRVREIIDLDCPRDRDFLREWNEKINPDQDWFKLLAAQRMTGVGNLQNPL